MTMAFTTRVPSFGGSPFTMPVGRARVHSRPIPNASGLAAAETLVAIAVLGLVIIGASVHEMPSSSQRILSLRITRQTLVLLALFTAGCPLLFISCGLYDANVIEDPATERRRVLVAVTLGTVLAVLLAALSHPGGLSSLDLVYFWLVAAPA